MVTLNAILYYSQEDGCYVVHCDCIDNVSSRTDRVSTIDDMLECVKGDIDFARNNKGFSWIEERNVPRHIKKALAEALLEDMKPEVREIPGYATLHIYDFINRKMEPDEELVSNYERER